MREEPERPPLHIYSLHWRYPVDDGKGGRRWQQVYQSMHALDQESAETYAREFILGFRRSRAYREAEIVRVRREE